MTLRAVESDDFAARAKRATRRPGPPCWTCALPAKLRDDIHAARKAGASITAIADTLAAELNVPLELASRVRYHFNLKHDARRR